MTEQARKRSPNYPRIGLEEAIVLARDIYRSAHQTRMDKETAFSLLGYRGESGRSLSVLSALKKFGLIVGDSKNLQVSDFALQILEPANSDEARNAIREAALKPEIFRDVIEFCGSSIPPNDDPIRAYLIRQRGFGQRGVDHFLNSFRSTIQFAGIDDLASRSESVNEKADLEFSKDIAESQILRPKAILEVRQEEEVFPDSRNGEFKERLIVRISPSATAEIKFFGDVSQAGVRKLINFLELSIDNYPD